MGSFMKNEIYIIFTRYLKSRCLEFFKFHLKLINIFVYEVDCNKKNWSYQINLFKLSSRILYV